MLIAIPSKARATRQITLRQLPHLIRVSTHLAVDVEEQSSYTGVHHPLFVVGPQVRGIGGVRQALVDFCHSIGETKLLMLDDDLTFAIRRTDEPTKFSTPTDGDIEAVIEDVEYKLDSYAHVSIAPREGGNRRIEPYVPNTRALRTLAFRVDKLKTYDIKFTDMEVMEDFYVQLSLLLKGESHLTINWMVQNQGGSNSEGGCSTYRTMEVQTRAAEALHAKFPDFVRVVDKETKTAWGGGTRKDVVVSWKAAYEEGRRLSDLPHFGHGHE